MALKGENIYLSCKAISSDPGEMTFQWKKNNMEITNGNITVTRTSSEDGNAETVSKLGIHKAETRDAGLYQCIVSNSFGTTYSQKSNISVLGEYSFFWFYLFEKNTKTLFDAKKNMKW